MPQQIDTSLRFVRAARAYFRTSVLIRLAILLALALPLVWLLIARANGGLEKIANEESSRSVQNLAHAVSEEVRSTITTIDLSLSQLRLSWLRNPEHLRAIVRELNTHLHGELLVNMLVTDARGIVLFSNVGDISRRVDLSDRAHIRVHLNSLGRDRLVIGKPMRGRLSRRWQVNFTRPIFDHAGGLVGVISASVSADYFARFFDTVDLGAQASIALLDGDGMVIARTTQESSAADNGRVLTGAPYAVSNGVHGHFQRVSRLDGIKRNYGWRRLPDYALIVTVGQAVDDALARYARQRRLLLSTGAATSLLLVLLGWMALTAFDSRRRAVAALAASEARWKLALNAAGEGVWDYSFTNRMLTLSPSAQGIIDATSGLVSFSDTAFLGKAHPDDGAAVLQALEAHTRGEQPQFSGQYRTLLSNGNWRWIQVRGRIAERDAAGQPLRMVGTVSDIDARKLQEDQIFHLAHHDALTGLPNRVLYRDRLRQALLVAQREGHKLAVIFFDLDRFKPVNDTYGHAVGDLLLQQVAVRLRAALRASDTLARLGGDEFVVLLPRVGSDADAQHVAATILQELNRPFIHGAITLEISGSVGVAVYPECGRDADTLLHSADLAMYDAKLHERRRVAALREAV